jgi:hypothetical protein
MKVINKSETIMNIMDAIKKDNSDGVNLEKLAEKLKSPTDEFILNMATYYNAEIIYEDKSE